MADVRPFRALRYDSSLDLSSIVCPPFDTISAEQQRELYERSPYNAVRIELAEESGAGRYENSGATVRQWMADGVLRRDERAAFYVHRQTFRHGEREYTRTMLFARVRVEPWSAGTVLPHEQTFGGPKEDRLRLMRATQLNPSPVFVFYRDEGGRDEGGRDEGGRDDGGRIRGLLEASEEGRTNVAEFVSPDGQRQSLSRLDDEDAVAELTKAFADKTIYIADGHHRFETALSYRDEAKAAANNWTGEEPENFAMIALVAQDDPGMLTLPTHRLTNIETPLAEALERLEVLFEVTTFEGSAADLVSQALPAAGGTAFGLVSEDGPRLLRVKDAAAIDALMPQERSPEWRALSYAIANQVILRQCLGLAERQMKDYSRFWFTEDAEKAERSVRGGEATYAVLLESMPVATVLSMADAGERMPQKSTFFWPKATTGLLFNLLE
ncbi:MAG: DUF1015 domain-containing protein [Chloroflexi bacterium]|nr:DUF1015 domain-containing protein [Chloroflexota bacterium]